MRMIVCNGLCWRLAGGWLGVAGGCAPLRHPTRLPKPRQNVVGARMEPSCSCGSRRPSVDA